jgi:Protein of unknown function (DUF2844)
VKRLARAGYKAAALLLAWAVTPAWAVLGGDLASVQIEQTRMHASRASGGTASGVSVHELRLPDGSSIRQFTNAQGIVFALAWRTRMKPDFAQWLGRYVADFDAAVAAQPRQPGLHRSVAIEQGDLVLQSGGRPGAFVGTAWLKSRMPAGMGADAIR